MLDEQVGHAHFKALQLLQLPDDVPGHYVAPPVHAWERDGLLNPADGSKGRVKGLHILQDCKLCSCCIISSWHSIVQNIERTILWQEQPSPWLFQQLRQYYLW